MMYAFFKGRIEFKLPKAYQEIFKSLMFVYFKFVDYDVDYIEIKQKGYLHRGNKCYFPDILLFLETYATISLCDLHFEMDYRTINNTSFKADVFYQDGKFICIKRKKTGGVRLFENVDLFIDTIQNQKILNGIYVPITNRSKLLRFLCSKLLERCLKNTKKHIHMIKKLSHLFTVYLNCKSVEFKIQKGNIYICDTENDTVSFQNIFPAAEFFTKTPYNLEETRKIQFNIDGIALEATLHEPLMGPLHFYIPKHENIIKVNEETMVDVCSQCVHRLRKIYSSCDVCSPRLKDDKL